MDTTDLLLDRTGPRRWGLPAPSRDTMLMPPLEPPATQVVGPGEATARALAADGERIAADAADRWLASWTDLDPTELTAVRALTIADGREHVAQLATAVAAERPALFADYLEWRASRYEAMALSPAEEHSYLGVLAEAIRARTDAAVAAPALRILERGARRLSDPRASFASFLPTDAPLAQLAARYLDALLAGETADALALVRAELAAGTDPHAVYLDVFQPALREVGRLWQLGRATVAQEHEVTRATEVAMAELAGRWQPAVGDGRRLVVACVGGEQHAVGARIVNDLFRLDGWQTHFLGADCPPGELAELVVARRAELVAVSATLSIHLPRVREVVTAVRARSGVPILVGGRPFNLVPDLWRVVGADGTAPDARGAVAVASALVGRQAA